LAAIIACLIFSPLMAWAQLQATAQPLVGQAVGDEVIIMPERLIIATTSAEGYVVTGLPDLDDANRAVGAMRMRPFLLDAPGDAELAHGLGLDNLWVVTLADGADAAEAVEVYTQTASVAWAALARIIHEGWLERSLR
jgi:hypothetical protein